MARTAGSACPGSYVTSNSDGRQHAHANSCKPHAVACVRCAGKLSNVVREMVTSQALAAASGHKRKQLLVMDEVDGMSGAPAVVVVL